MFQTVFMHYKYADQKKDGYQRDRAQNEKVFSHNNRRESGSELRYAFASETLFTRERYS